MFLYQMSIHRQIKVFKIMLQHLLQNQVRIM